jgi:predicted HAD superfamily Cof-like phosphohydrolase
MFNSIAKLSTYVFSSMMPYSWTDILLSYNFVGNSYKIEKRVTDFDKVLEFNRLFNVPQISESKSNEENAKIIENGIALITEELNELKEAVKNNDKIEIKDALCDLVYVIYGLLYRIKMTSNAKLYDIAENYLTINNDDMKFYYNPYQDLYEIISENIIDNIENYEDITNNEKMLFNLGEKLNAIVLTGKFYNINSFNLSVANYYLTYRLVDMLIKVYEIGSVRFDFKESFDIVHRSNMSKICSSVEEAEATVESYKRRFELGEVPYDSPYYDYISPGKWMVRNRSTQKVLKNINYHPVEEFEGWLE